MVESVAGAVLWDCSSSTRRDSNRITLIDAITSRQLTRMVEWSNGALLLVSYYETSMDQDAGTLELLPSHITGLLQCFMLLPSINSSSWACCTRHARCHSTPQSSP